MKLYPQPPLHRLSSKLSQRLHQKTRSTTRLYSNTTGILELKENGHLVRLLAQDQPLETLFIEEEDGHCFILDSSRFSEEPLPVMQVDPDHHYSVEHCTTYSLSPTCLLILQHSSEGTDSVYIEGPDKQALLSAASTFLSLLK